MGPTEEQEDQQEAGSWGASVRGDQTGVRLGACAGDDGEAGACEDGVRVFLLQLGSAGHLGGEVVAWAIGVLREKAVGWWSVW